MKKHIYVVHPGDGQDTMVFLASDKRKVRARLKKMLFENEDNDLEALEDAEDILSETYIERVTVYEV